MRNGMLTENAPDSLMGVAEHLLRIWRLLDKSKDLIVSDVAQADELGENERVFTWM
jgi:hypothetical protein